jgi:hypothetical protein
VNAVAESSTTVSVVGNNSKNMNMIDGKNIDATRTVFPRALSLVAA